MRATFDSVINRFMTPIRGRVSVTKASNLFIPTFKVFQFELHNGRNL